MIINSTTQEQLKKMVSLKPTDEGKNSQYVYFLMDLKTAVITDGHLIRVEYLQHAFPMTETGDLKIQTKILSTSKPELGIRCELNLLPLNPLDVPIVEILKKCLVTGENKRNAIASNKAFNPKIVGSFLKSLPKSCTSVFTVSYEKGDKSPIYFYSYESILLGLVMPIKLGKSSFIFNPNKEVME